MARRLTVDARRREIVERTRQLIAEQGPDGLSLRAVARWCDMSAPGLMHHFAGLKPLLEEVLRERAEAEAEAYAAALPENPTLRDWADTVARVAMDHVLENRNFDALETQALANPDHPAHDFYVRAWHPYSPTVELAQKEYPRNPQVVSETLRTVVDGLRLRWLRSQEAPDYAGDWGRIADTVFAGFEQYRA